MLNLAHARSECRQLFAGNRRKTPSGVLRFDVDMAGKCALRLVKAHDSFTKPCCMSLQSFFRRQGFVLSAQLAE